MVVLGWARSWLFFRGRAVGIAVNLFQEVLEHIQSFLIRRGRRLRSGWWSDLGWDSCLHILLWHDTRLIQDGRMNQLRLGLETDLAAPAVTLPEDIEAEVIALLAEAIKTVYEKGKEVGRAECGDQ